MGAQKYSATPVLMGDSWLSISMASCLNLSLNPSSYIYRRCAVPVLSLHTETNLFYASEGDSCIRVPISCGIT